LYGHNLVGHIKGREEFFIIFIKMFKTNFNLLRVDCGRSGFREYRGARGGAETFGLFKQLLTNKINRVKKGEGMVKFGTAEEGDSALRLNGQHMGSR
jgi:hypothetical protein